MSSTGAQYGQRGGAGGRRLGGALPTLRQVNFGHGEHRNPEYLAVNPVGKIPALRLPDGSVMTESAAILLYLCELAPGKIVPGGGQSGLASGPAMVVFHGQRYLRDDGLKLSL